MIKNGLHAFKDKRLLMLQGPVGPFFMRFARDVEHAGAQVYKVNFNGGDWLFYPWNSLPFRGLFEEWPATFEKILDDYAIDIVLLFNDCRPVHSIVKEIAKRRSFQTYVFEEGYIRPDYITLELFGANGHSQTPCSPDFYLNLPPTEIPPSTIEVGNTYWYQALWAILYWIASVLFKPFFPHYQHHRPLTLKEAFPWIRSAWRKVYFSIKEKSVLEKLSGRFAGKYFLVPLQVHNDSQIRVHSEFDSIGLFIEQVVESFQQYAPPETIVVIKHHPMDRGYVDYTHRIKQLIQKHKLQQKVLYIHDQHLPTLLEHSRGVIVINSTVGISALDQGKPVKVCGSAIYNMSGLTYQGELDTFWNQAQQTQLDHNLFERFRRFLIAQTQLNGSFYRRLNHNEKGAGLVLDYVHQKEEPHGIKTETTGNEFQ